MLKHVYIPLQLKIILLGGAGAGGGGDGGRGADQVVECKLDGVGYDGHLGAQQRVLEQPHRAHLPEGEHRVMTRCSGVAHLCWCATHADVAVLWSQYAH